MSHVTVIRESQDRKTSDINIKDKINLFSQKAKEENTLQARKNTQPKAKKPEDQSQQSIEEINQNTEYAVKIFYYITVNRPTEHQPNEAVEPVQRGNTGQGFESRPVEEYIIL